MIKGTNILPMVTLQGIVMFPGTLIRFDVNDEKSKKAIKAAMNKEQLVFLSMEGDNKIGVISKIKHYIKLPNDSLRVLIEGISRAELLSSNEIDAYDSGKVVFIEDEGEKLLSFYEKEALLRALKELFISYAKEIGTLGKETIRQISEIENLNELIDEISVNINLALEQKREILVTLDIIERHEKLSKYILEERNILKIKKDYQIKVNKKVEKNQKEYLLKEQLELIREELGDSGNDYIDEYIKKTDSLIVSEEVKDKIKTIINRLKSFNNNSTEAAVERKYIELLLELPWDKLSPESDDLEFAQNVLEEDHYGLKEVKERIIEFLSVRILTKAGDTPIICLVGPPGTGKTSIAKSIARALNKEYVKISLGGVRDEAEIRGHRRTYVAALPGIIVQGIKNAGVKNPLFLLDEIDKVGSDSRGDVSSALLEVLDSEQNNKFVDHFVEMPVDLSEVLFICTANSIRNIQKPLLDRLEVIEVPSYTENEKFHIGKDFLYKKQLKNNGLKKSQLTISDTAIVKVIAGYTREAGVRQLERNFGKLCRKAAKAIVIDDKDKVRISINNLSDYLGKERFTYEQANKKDQIGIVRGLAWTSMGGDTLEIEVNIMPGKGKFRVTGQIGGVMKESAQAGISYIRSVSKKYNIDSTYFDKYDIHIHIPQGAVPKDGPSAGVSMTTAILSAIIGRKVKADLAMTGEVTIRGRVLKVGGLKEKLLAAKMAKISTVLVPKDNERDIEEIDTEIKDGIHIKYIKDMDEVINYSILTKE